MYEHDHDIYVVGFGYEKVVALLGPFAFVQLAATGEFTYVDTRKDINKRVPETLVTEPRGQKQGGRRQLRITIEPEYSSTSLNSRDSTHHYQQPNSAYWNRYKDR